MLKQIAQRIHGELRDEPSEPKTNIQSLEGQGGNLVTESAIALCGRRRPFGKACIASRRMLACRRMEATPCE
jgi:hypothetical protein